MESAWQVALNHPLHSPCPCSCVLQWLGRDSRPQWGSRVSLAGGRASPALPDERTPKCDWKHSSNVCGNEDEGKIRNVSSINFIRSRSSNIQHSDAFPVIASNCYWISKWAMCGSKKERRNQKRNSSHVLHKSSLARCSAPVWRGGRPSSTLLDILARICR